jgi:hypothetical protein
MSLQRIKLIVSALCLSTALVTILAAGASVAGNLFISALGIIPPLALLLLWKDPLPTMSERINAARR